MALGGAARGGLYAALMVLSLAAGALGMPALYTCDPATCSPPDCACAATAPPAGLAPEDTPQFVVITHDDAVTAVTSQGIRGVIDQHKNRNGCNVPATFFVLEAGTSCELARSFWEENSELAIHSKTHAALNDPWTGPGTLEGEMFSARIFLNQTCGIPLEDLVGFRAPLLLHNPPVREALAAEGMLYDSSIQEFWGPNSEISSNATDRLWPYTMDSGIPQDCAYFAGNKCLTNETYPGLWELPLLATQSANGTLLFSMDPGRGSDSLSYNATEGPGMPAAKLEALLKANFDASYYGNRAPWGLYLHTPWLTEERTKVANNLLEYVLSLNNTWIVTQRTVVEWMQDPVPASEMDAWLTCKEVDLSSALGTAECQVYEVQMGDTGSALAELFGVSLQELGAINPNLASLQLGELLKIPPFPASCGAGKVVPRPTPTAPGAAAATRRLLRRAGPPRKGGRRLTGWLEITVFPPI